jgi:Mn2+/Fe2+ NRAMP family transporter
MFWQCSEEVEETQDLQEVTKQPSRRRVSGMQVDVIVGMTTAVLIMFAILVSAASTLGAHGITNIGTADQAARALKPIAGNFAGLLFALGIVGTGALAVPVLAGSTGYALAETFHWHEGLSKSLRKARAFYVVIICSMVVGLFMNFIGLNPIKALVYSALLNGLAAPPLILLMLILGNREKAVHGYRSGRVSNALVGIAFLLMAGLPVAYLIAR